MPNNPIHDEQLAELDRLHEAAIKGMNWQEVAQFQAIITEQYQPMRQRLTDAESRKDNEELDGTDAAHPAWWRGNDAGVAQVCAQINAILDGADVSGTASEPWESTRRRVAEARKDLERLREVLESGKADRWAATVGNTETNAFRPSGWVVRAEAALALIPASAAARLKAEAE